MSLKNLVYCMLLFPIMVQAQDNTEAKAIKIEILQALNKLESGIKNPPSQLIGQRDHILAIMERELAKNTSRTEKLMKTPGRSETQRDQIQDQLALTAKQKYLKRTFAELDWQGEKLSPKTTLDLVRNFMNLIQ